MLQRRAEDIGRHGIHAGEAELMILVNITNRSQDENRSDEVAQTRLKKAVQVNETQM